MQENLFSSCSIDHKRIVEEIKKVSDFNYNQIDMQKASLELQSKNIDEYI